MPRTRKVLANEWDQPAHTALGAVLVEEGARRLFSWRGSAGSQDVRSAWIWLHGLVIVTSETYMGLTVSGPANVVEMLARRVRERLAGEATP